MDALLAMSMVPGYFLRGGGHQFCGGEGLGTYTEAVLFIWSSRHLICSSVGMVCWAGWILTRPECLMDLFERICCQMFVVMAMGISCFKRGLDSFTGQKSMSG